MLLELRIENLLLIERAELRLGDGPERDHRRDRRGQDDPRPLARPADGRQGAAADRPAGGRARPTSRASSSCPTGLLDDPELAEIAERLPDGADEIVLGRRVGASGRTSAFVAGPLGVGAPTCSALGSRLLAFYGQHEHRKLTLASAQLEILDGFAGAEHLERRRATARPTREVARARARAGRAPRARGRARARPRPAALRARGDRGGGARPRRGGGARGRARAAAPRRGAARRRRRRARRGSRRRTTTAAAQPRRSPRPRRRSAAVDGVDPALDALAERARGAGGRARATRRASCAPTSTASRPSPGGWSRSRSASTCSTG